MKPGLWIILFALAMALSAPAENFPPGKLSAFAAVQEGNKLVATQARDRVTGIHSEQSTNGLAPDVWYVEYLDPTVPFKKTQIKLVGRKMVEMTHPRHVFDTFNGSRQIEKRKLKIDSDHALKLVLKDKTLSKLNLQAAQYWLERTGEGPVWRIRLWMPQLNHPGQLNQIGEVSVSTQTGEIFKSDLHY